MVQLTEVKNRLMALDTLISLHQKLFDDHAFEPIHQHLVTLLAKLEGLTSKDELAIKEVQEEAEKTWRACELSIIVFMKQKLTDAIPKQDKMDTRASKSLGASVRKLFKQNSQSMDKTATTMLMETMKKSLDDSEQRMVADSQYYIKAEEMISLIQSFAKLFGIEELAPEIKPAVPGEMSSAAEPSLPTENESSTLKDFLSQTKAVAQRARKHRVIDLSAPIISPKEGLTAKIIEQEQSLKKQQEIRKKISLVGDAMHDPLVVYQLELLDQATKVISMLSTSRDRLYFEQEIIQLYEKKLFEPKAFATMDDEMRAKVIRWIEQWALEKDEVSWRNITTWTRLLSSKNPSEEEITLRRLKIINKKAMELQVRNQVRPLSDDIRAVEDCYLQALLEQSPIITKITNLIEERLDELDQLQSSVSDYLATENASAVEQGRVRNLPRVIQKVVLLRTEIDRIYEAIQKADKSVPKVDNDPLIDRLIKKHNELLQSMEIIVHERDSRVAPYVKPEAFMTTPLEYDRMVAQFDPNQQCFDSLTTIKKQFYANLQELHASIAERNKLMRVTADSIKANIEAVIDDLQKIKRMKVYKTILDRDIDEAILSLERIRFKVKFLSINGLPMSVKEITQVKTALLSDIVDAMSPIKTQLNVIHQSLDRRISIALSELSGLILSIGMTIFRHERRQLQFYEMNDALGKLGSNLKTGLGILVDRQYAQLTTLEARIAKEKEAFNQIKQKRGNSELTRIVTQMISAINRAIEQASEAQDCTKTILLPMLRPLELNKEGYLSLRINEKQFIEDSLTIITEGLSAENMNQLTEPRLNAFQRWIRHLVDPLMQYIYRHRHVTYWPHLFATPVEKEISATAQSMHKTLNDHRAPLENAEVDLEESVLDNALMVESMDEDSTGEALSNTA